MSECSSPTRRNAGIDAPRACRVGMECAVTYGSLCIWCVTSRSDFNTFMLWEVQLIDVPFLESVNKPCLGIEQSGLLDLSDCAQLGQQVGYGLAPFCLPVIS